MRRAWIGIIILALAQPGADAFSPEAALERYQLGLWYVGKGIIPGDSFTYAVCDHMHTFLAQLGQCYHVILDFYIELESQGRDVWVVQAEIYGADDGSSSMHIFLVDSETLDITTDHIGSDYARSVRETVMYLAQFAGMQTPKPLDVGSIWGSVPSAFNVGSDIVVASREKADHGDVHVVRFGLFEQSTFVVSGEMPFPVSGVVYDPHHTGGDSSDLFAFELVDHEPAPPDHTIPGSNGTMAYDGTDVDPES